MTWTRHFQTVKRDKRLQNALRSAQSEGQPTANGTSNKYASYLPEIYAGHPQRIERYGQYDAMDNDSEVNTALNTIADFGTRSNEDTGALFNLVYNGRPDDTEVEVLRTVLNQWTNLNQFKKRLWRIFRSTLKYGDQFFIRDPETMRWHWVSHDKVEKVLVNEAEGKEPEQYLIRDLELNLQNLTGTGPSSNNAANNAQQQAQQGKTWGNQGMRGSGYSGQQSMYAVDATHVVHLSLSEGLDANWPFGNSILDPVFKVFKQKEMLEDAILIYRVQRAPERRVFYIDVGQMQAHKANAHLERVKMEIHQRRIPTRNGGGTSIMDAAYNPLSMMEDYFFAQTADGRGSKVETLPGGENLGQIDDLRHFNNKLIRGLGVPSSYLPTGPEDGNAAFVDGRVGTAYMQEYRFACFVERLQQLIVSVFDDEFKLFVKQRGYNIDAGLFELEFNPPQNFRQFAQIERDAAQINVFSQLAEIPYFSKRFLLERFLGLTEEEIIRNESLWKEENKSRAQPAGAGSAGGGGGGIGGEPGLDSIGFRPDEGGDDLGGDDLGDETDDAGDGSASPISGDEGTTDDGDNPL